jgi:hypothetical protein
VLTFEMTEVVCVLTPVGHWEERMTVRLGRVSLVVNLK